MKPLALLVIHFTSSALVLGVVLFISGGRKQTCSTENWINAITVCLLPETRPDKDKEGVKVGGHS